MPVLTKFNSVIEDPLVLSIKNASINYAIVNFFTFFYLTYPNRDKTRYFQGFRVSVIDRYRATLFSPRFKQYLRAMNRAFLLPENFKNYVYVSKLQFLEMMFKLTDFDETNSFLFRKEYKVFS